MKIQDLYKLFLTANGVTTDSRQIKDNALFFALKGGNFDGNKYAKGALEKGASYAVVDDENVVCSDQFILVDDVLSTLQELAKYHRQQFDIPVIAITGSNGKTTTKEILLKVCETTFKTHATKGNFNNHIGVPLTLLDMPLGTEVALIEMGDNHVGEVAELVKIALPNQGFVTNIGKDHIEGFGSFEQNVRAKSEIFDYLIKNEGIIYINSQDDLLMNMSKRMQKPVFYGGEYDFSNLEFVEVNPFIVYKDRQEKRVETNLFGAYNFENIQTAFCVGKFLGISAEKMHQAIASYIPSNNRSEIVKTTSNTLILDAYNANPSSVEVALENLKLIESDKKKYIILGDMFELGDISSQEHKNIIDKALNLGFAACIFIGERFGEHSSDKALFFDDKEKAIQYLGEQKVTEGIILIKGSRSMGLEILKDSFE
ncbi:UDP-N-acetylmuramoyl-tripeptide--D-alanyl-D-alanine ligase [Flammeovirga yaeyamensis]|uniref:UDP-N-acetylmuramoyl-tripeptide--D-alanyl-D-alanine ligase n=1 Tax=Flammeovirga yaeyamensis TaxID=367791 RepID=A0AAX1N1Y7_9BACT|nr:UDP-N-acetylmuramoyl-tripeptide--D-alanyl-D-alanine ligase [Flammeovirga yaeyamensis]MBB3696434.1 UDP-N-acetylmuramoyl-tripeptide--D-alanyl-D-alanine ligase [Flammeovirga yaeyamensis]NMF35113.1 UDP-N-acetylmuramoyl-tripeptide--D-alanyl-D-alanine ligase [Flammeovirga yaeyamensis]QWG00067.1 UDP-N-acetylmuramoyl-tripeptide--D-alanyl-D-alanine ligase [Flammeovirga yaeyamensis]